MSTQEVRIPDLGGADEVEVIEISVKPGDEVEPEQTLIVVESDKATVELPSPAGGTIQELKVKVGDKVKQGDLVAMLDAASDNDEQQKESGKEQADKPQMKEKPDAVQRAAETEASEAEEPEKKSGGGQREETVKVPGIGEAAGVTVIEVSVKPGDQVKAEDSLIVLESDKATMEIPAPVSGTVKELLVKVQDTVEEGTPIAILIVDEGANQDATPQKAEKQSTRETVASSPSPSPDRKEAAPKAPPQRPAGGQQDESQANADASAQKVHAGPAVRKVAREFGVDLAQVPGSGPKHRILKEDVQAFVKSSLKQGASGAHSGSFGLPQVKLPDFSQFGKIERRAMSKIHRATAENMQRSWLNVPHVTQFDEADITALEEFRKDQKAVAEQRGVKLTLVPFIIKACAYALRAYPQFNVSLDTHAWELIQKDYVHIGMAVDTPAGLMVPVIRDADQKGIWDLARESAELAGRARDRKLQPNDMQGGCFSISSLGGIGGTAFTPIVNTPEVAILGLSQAQIKPQYMSGQFQPRLMLPLSLSYDHRAVNGADAARFTALLGKLLSDIRQLLL